MRRYQKGMVLMVEHILFAVLTAAVIGAAIFMWWFENHDEKPTSSFLYCSAEAFPAPANGFCCLPMQSAPSSRMYNACV